MSHQRAWHHPCLPLEYLLLKAIQSLGLAALNARIEAGKGCDASVFHVAEEAVGNQARFEAALQRKLRAIHAKAPGFVAG